MAQQQLVTADRLIPIEFVFNPNWWFQTAGISFDESFYMDPAVRSKHDVTMRRVLHERYGYPILGLGEANPQPRNVLGSMFVAGGWVVPALLGARVEFCKDAAPQPFVRGISVQEVEQFQKPDIRTTWPMTEFLAQMEAAQGEMVGDFNTGGVLNEAFYLHGEELFADFRKNPTRARNVLDMTADVIMDVAEAVRTRTGSCSIAVNRQVEHVDRGMFCHGNCSNHMISPRHYGQVMLPVEQRMAKRMRSFGIHHCGDNFHKIATEYAKITDPSPIFFDVGWGSDVAEARRILPNAFLNLRLSPMNMLRNSAADVARDTENLLLAAGPLEAAGVVCINMDYGTPDDNIRAVAEVVERFRQQHQSK